MRGVSSALLACLSCHAVTLALVLVFCHAFRCSSRHSHVPHSGAMQLNCAPTHGIAHINIFTLQAST